MYGRCPVRYHSVVVCQSVPAPTPSARRICSLPTSHHSFLSQYGSSLLGGMSQATVATNKKFILWLNANGLDVPRDFKFAFTSASKAAEACPEAPDSAAQAWEAIDYDEVEVPSSWTLWVQRPRSAIRPQAQQPGRAPALGGPQPSSGGDFRRRSFDRVRALRTTSSEDSLLQGTR